MDEFNFVPEEETSPEVNQNSGFSFTPENDDIDVSKYNAANIMAINKGENVNTIEKIGYLAERFVKDIIKDGMEFGGNLRASYAGYESLKEQGKPFEFKDVVKEPSKMLARSTFEIFKGLGNTLQVAGDNLKLSAEQISSGNFPKGDVILWDSLGGGLNYTGEVIKKYSNVGLDWELLKPDDKIFEGTIVDNPSWARISSVVAGALPSLAEGIFIKKITGSSTLAYALSAGIENGDLYEEAKGTGLSVDKATQLYLLGTGGTMGMDLVGRPIDRILHIKTSNLTGKIGKVVSDATVEGTTEMFQQVWQNSVKKYGYDESQRLLDGTIESFIGGAGSGGISSSFVTVMGAQNYQNNIDAMRKKGLTDDEILVFQEVVADEMAQKRAVVNPLIQENIDKSLKSFDDYITNNAEVLSNEKMRKELQTVYDDTYELLSDNMEPVQAKYNAKLAQGWALFGAKETGLTPLEYMNLHFPKVTSAQEREMMAKKNLRRDIEKIKNPLLIKKTPAPKSLSQFLKQSGGLQDFQGELKALGANEVKGLVKDGGIKLDDATRLAWENGYLQGQERPEINELLDALSEDIAGNFVYAESLQENEASYIRQLAEDFDRAGIDIKTQDIDTIYQQLKEYQQGLEQAQGLSEQVVNQSIDKELDDFILFQENKPQIKIKGDELGEYADLAELRGKSFNYMERKIRGRRTYNFEIGADIEIRKTAVKKYFIFSADIDKLKAVPYLLEIISKGKIVKKMKPYDESREKNIKWYYELETKVSLEGENKVFSTIIKEDDKNNFFWDLQVNKKNPSSYTSYNTRRDGLNKTKTSYYQNITQDNDDFNLKITNKSFGSRGRIDFMDDSRAIINLFANADASTFIHEMGHFFLRELNEFAKYSNDSKIRLAEVNKWLSVDESGVYTREQEEQFARGFEQFVREGKAPSNYLKQVFNRFAEWLRHIYKSAEELEVVLSDEVRQVYADLFGGKELDRYFDKNFQESFEVINKARFEKNNEAISTLYAQNLSRVTNQNQFFSKMVDKTSKITQDLGGWLENAIVPLEEPIRKIAPELFWKNRRLEIAKLNRTKVYHERIKGFIEGMEQIANTTDFYNLDLALKNRDETKIMEILERNNLSQEFKEVKKLLAELYHELLNVGVDVGHLDVYFPRRIKDANGLLNFVEMKYQGTEEYSMIEKALAEKQKDGRVLSIEDKAQLVNSLIRGYGGKITLSNIGNVKSREIDVIDGELNQFYKISTDALVDYVSGVSVLLEDKAYFGKESQELQKLRTSIRGRRTRIQEYQAMEPKEAKWKEIKRLNYEIAGQEAKFRNAFREEDKLDAQERKSYLEGQVEYYTKVNPEFVKRKTLERMNADVSELQAQLEKLDGKVIEESVGHLILNLVEQGRIKATEERRLRELLTARFSNKGLGNEALKFLRDGGYLFTLGNFESAITQLGDLGLSAYEAGLWNTFVEFGKAIVNKSEVTKEMVGLSNTIVRELRQDEGYLTKALDKVLGWTGFEKLDRLGKQTLMNAAINKARSQAKNNNVELDEYLKVAYGQNYTKVKQDLIAGEITPEIIEFALFKLMDVQPLTIDQMPSFYAEGGKKRVFYMLKSYSIKIINLYRGLVFEKSRKNPVGAMKDMAMLTAYLMLFNAGADLLKDLLFGRKIDIADTMVDNMAMGGVFGKFQGMQAKREGLIMTFLSQMMPPVIVDTLFVDVMGSKDIEDWRTWNQIPLVGRFYYWYLGGGKAKKEQEEAKGKNKNKRRNARKRRED